MEEIRRNIVSERIEDTRHLSYIDICREVGKCDFRELDRIPITNEKQTKYNFKMI